MSKDGLRARSYLGHILEAIQRINRYTRDLTEASFLENELVQDAVIRNIEIIGEAVRNIGRYDPEFSAQHPDVPWEDIYLMRNRVSHGYFSVDLGIVWKTVQRDMPELERKILQLREGLGPRPEDGADDKPRK